MAAPEAIRDRAGDAQGSAKLESPIKPEKAPLRIGIDIRRLGDFGVGTYINNLVHALRRAETPSTSYVLIGNEGQFERLGPLGPNFESQIYPRRFNSRRSHFDFPLGLRGLQLNVFHMPHRWVPYFLPGPYVATLHDINNILFPEEDPSSSPERVRRHMLARGLRRAARVIAVSEATKRDAVTHLGLSPDRIEVVHNAIDEQVGRPVTDNERIEVLHRYQIRGPFVLYTGRIQPHKNIPRLIEAFAVAKAELEKRPEYSELTLIVIGDQSDAFPAVRHAVMRSRVQQSVRFLGFVPVETLRCFYEAATAFLFPSLYEGFGLPPLEAMAHGTPVITSNLSSMPEAVGDAAVLVNPENVFEIARGLQRVLLDETLREQLRRRGREQVARFSWDQSARRVLAIYHQVGRDQYHVRIQRARAE